MCYRTLSILYTFPGSVIGVLVVLFLNIQFCISLQNDCYDSARKYQPQCTAVHPCSYTPGP